MKPELVMVITIGFIAGNFLYMFLLGEDHDWKPAIERSFFQAMLGAAIAMTTYFVNRGKP